ncbi:flagellar biosynthetic protein FliO [Nocardioides daejeonensis]|uniref:flagellar biosynthetic protein FliO n=1 Tax=Nocardioides daejeonensis TaxID=1046556 RepID=UPI000D74934A|nr:flagellar biosynthetic protein FliO [Nocardioides daejeonensis]
MLELTLRLIASLAVVVGLLVLLARFGGKRFRGGPGAPVQVLHRQPLTRTSSISVVAVGDRVLVLGCTEQQVNVLTELDPDQVGGAELTLLPGLAASPDAVDAVASQEDFATTLAQVTAPAQAAEPRRTAGAHRAVARSTAAGTLQGSILSPQTWRQALAAVGRRAS